MVSLALLPLLWLQGVYARRRTPRLPEAGGLPSGIAGHGEPALRLAVIGESPVAGVGVDQYEDSLTAQIAKHLARVSGREVQWSAMGENGANIRDAGVRLVPKLAGLRPDIVVVATGVNDTTQLTSRPRWRSEVRALVEAIRIYSDAPILFAPVPPVASFTTLPRPLRSVLGIRARLLNGDLMAAMQDLQAVYFAGELAPLPRQFLSRDGYHPSAEGCDAWGVKLADSVAALLR